MKIAVDVLSIRPDGSAGGATEFALELIKGFASKQDVQVLVLCAEWNIKYLKVCLPQNIQFCQMMGAYHLTRIDIIDRTINWIKQRIQSKSVLSKNRVDILYCPFGAATYKEKGIPTVSTILDIQHEYYPQFFEPQELAHRRKFYQDIVKRVERAVCISDYTRKTFCEKYGFPAERAQTIYIAIQNRFIKENKDILDRLNIRNQKYIVYPANFWEHKNHKLLLNAFAMYMHYNCDLKLVLTGNPLEQTEYYTSLLKAMEISEYVVITGYISNEELYSILKNAIGLIYPSLFEGFGIPVVEAMYLHKLIACSNLTSLPEIGCNAICYFNPKKPDEILRGIHFLTENRMTEEIVREYNEKLQVYETSKMIEAYLNVFKDTINSKEDFVFQEEIEGIYPDGWSGAEILVQLKNRAGEKIKIVLSLPEFVGIKQKITLRNNKVERHIIMQPGESIILEEKIDDDCCTITLKMNKLWSPKTVLRTTDARDLGVMVNELILESDEKKIDLKMGI